MLPSLILEINSEYNHVIIKTQTYSKHNREHALKSVLYKFHHKLICKNRWLSQANSNETKTNKNHFYIYPPDPKKKKQIFKVKLSNS